MNRFLLIGAVAGLSVAGTSAVAWAAGDGGAAGAHHQPAGRAHPAVVAQPVDNTVESKFTPIAPCRAADTRYGGGPLAANTTRNFRVVGTTSFASQGGSSTGCGVPADATAVATTITTLATHNGYLKAWSYGTSAPASSYMNFGTSFAASSGGVIPLAHSSFASIRSSVSNTGVILDITGYYVEPLRAKINFDGTLDPTAANRVTATQHLATGQYEIDFDRNVSGCDYAVTPFYVGYTVGAQPRSGNADGVFVYAESGTSFADVPFYLTVTC
ncbi:hypothetical protein [Allobranchiibius sp. GilTou38]|uniref:hypothetical protein n=1 Tax=Allobranchiibius sp. GilTou38 TaxID=2815210 RepID=UPI001AA1BAB1|nr:hypothetical protein [Allobranchiibius sp. GilTou38]MBO1767227.1 hypothetical protein [Allobranchiibius sp. GilTou38]